MTVLLSMPDTFKASRCCNGEGPVASPRGLYRLLSVLSVQLPQAMLPRHRIHRIHRSTKQPALHLPRPFFHILGYDCQEQDHILFTSESQCLQHGRWSICLASEWMSSVNSTAHKQLSCEQSTLVWNIWAGFTVFLPTDLCTLGR